MKQPPDPAKVSRYKGDRRPVTIVLSGELILLAQTHFSSTKHGSLSRFVEAAIKSEFRKKASRIRATGLRVPESVFSK